MCNGFMFLLLNCVEVCNHFVVWHCVASMICEVWPLRSFRPKSWRQCQWIAARAEHLGWPFLKAEKRCLGTVSLSEKGFSFKNKGRKSFGMVLQRVSWTIPSISMHFNQKQIEVQFAGRLVAEVWLISSKCLMLSHFNIRLLALACWSRQAFLFLC